MTRSIGCIAADRIDVAATGGIGLRQARAAAQKDLRRRANSAEVSGDLSVPAAVELQELHYRFNSCLSLFTATVKLDASRDPRYRAKLEQWMVANLCRRRVEIVLRFVDLN